jgi:hypothetical protein
VRSSWIGWRGWRYEPSSTHAVTGRRSRRSRSERSLRPDDAVLSERLQTRLLRGHCVRRRPGRGKSLRPRHEAAAVGGAGRPLACARHHRGPATRSHRTQLRDRNAARRGVGPGRCDLFVGVLCAASEGRRLLFERVQDRSVVRCRRCSGQELTAADRHEQSLAGRWTYVAQRSSGAIAADQGPARSGGPAVRI